jgi:hypothetical protein
MIIDFHTHYYPDKIAPTTIEHMTNETGTLAATDGTVSGLSASMLEAGVDISVVLPVATAPRQVNTINRVAAETNEIYKDRKIISFGGIHPDCENYKEIIKSIARSGMKGIKLHPDYQDTYINDIKYKRILSCAEENGLITVVHGGQDIGRPNPIHSSVDGICELIRDVEPHRLVIAHLGGWQMWNQVYEKICGKDVYLDTAFSYGELPWKRGSAHIWNFPAEEVVLKIIRKHGCNKVLFGTDSPWYSQRKALEELSGLPLSPEEKDMILGLNAKKLLDIK